MDELQQMKLDFQKKSLQQREDFDVRKHKRAMELIVTRAKLSKENVMLRDKVATKRHQERIAILGKQGY